MYIKRIDVKILASFLELLATGKVFIHNIQLFTQSLSLSLDGL